MVGDAAVRPVRRRRRRPQVNPELRAPGAARTTRIAKMARADRRERRQRPTAAAGGAAAARRQRAAAGRGGRAARPRRAAARDHLHLQPRRLRRRGRAVPRRRAAADHRRRSGCRSARSSSSAAADLPRGGPRRCSATASGATGSSAASPRTTPGMLPTFKETVEELFHRGPGQGGLRHRDARAGHQHAGPHRGAREARQVQRRDPRRPDAGGVHPAHRPGRAARHRRRGPRGRAVAPGRRPARGRRARLDAHLPAALVVPAVVQHGGQPRRLGRPPRGARAAGDRRSRSSRPTARWSGLARQVRKQRGGARRLPRGDGLPPRRLRRVRRAAPAAHRPREGAGPRRRGRGAGPRPPRRSSALKPGDVIMVPAGRRSGVAVVLDPGLTSSDEPRPPVLTDRPAGEAAVRASTSRRPSSRSSACASRSCSTRARPTRAATSRPSSRTLVGDIRVDRPRKAQRGQRRGRAGARAAPPDPRSTPATAATSARSTPAGPSATTAWLRETRGLERRVETRTNSIARQFDRVCAILTELGYLTADGRLGQGHRRRADAAAALQRHGPRGRRVPAPGAVERPHRRRAGGVRVRARVRVAPVRRRDAAEAPARPRRATCSPSTVTLWGELSQLEAEERVRSCASPTSASPGRRTAGRPGSGSSRCCATPSCRPATSSAGASSSPTCSARSPTPPGSHSAPEGIDAGRAPRAQAVDAVKRGVVSFSSV